jgi:hypothetical protein
MFEKIGLFGQQIIIAMFLIASIFRKKTLEHLWKNVQIVQNGHNIDPLS